MHRSLSGRVTALLLAFLASFSAPGAALAHGAAHQREHHGDRGRREAVLQADHDDRGGRSHHEHGTVGAAVELDRTAAGVAVVGMAVASQDELVASHGHPALDLPVRPRVEFAVIRPPLASGTTIASPETEDAGGTPVPHAALPRPDPDAAPPPRTRAPPLH